MKIVGEWMTRAEEMSGEYKERSFFVVFFFFFFFFQVSTQSIHSSGFLSLALSLLYFYCLLQAPVASSAIS